MSKTPEQMAEEYIAHVLESQCDCSYRIAFLAGYQAAKPQWISVKDRLPEEGQDCIFYVDFVDEWDKGSERINFQEIGVFNGKDRFYHRSHTDLDRVTYWMPLPEAPKE
jgi:hypothetical protein